jgi:hypothetical protein
MSPIGPTGPIGRQLQIGLELPLGDQQLVRLAPLGVVGAIAAFGSRQRSASDLQSKRIGRSSGALLVHGAASIASGAGVMREIKSPSMRRTPALAAAASAL